MTKRMLIDATHTEETRVAVVENNRLIEFDYESKFRKPLKGSIFLAKVTRVEPSLQAAFVNFGGNRHGFLPFSEIHPDYFRIPISDREALIAEQEELMREVEENDSDEDSEDEENSAEDSEDSSDDDDFEEIEEIGGNTASLEEDQDDTSQNKKQKSKNKTRKSDTDTEDDQADNKDDSDENDEEGSSEDRQNRHKHRGRRGGRGRYNRGGNRRASHKSRQVEILGGTEYEDDGAPDAAERARFALRRKYKIQEVIKRGQIMLIQVSREERGNKGAAVSTYLSMPGRYGVLMPNSPRAGGVSRKIANPKDRARLRDMLKDLDVPKGMSVILRTAGVARTKTEIKRDIDYLLRLWSDIRELTLNSTAPALIYEEADLMKRAVRDLYTREVEEILVSGKEGHATAKKFMKMMIPSHAKRVKEYNEDVPLFHKYKVEEQISEIGEPTARLKSGGYLVINPTEALVSIDVNSGRATKERHIEETALNTNMEAAEEVARQLRLRDLGGLVVVDFIDMEDRRNNYKVERKLKEALSSDRARIQIGRISSFGLLEMSRQRLNPSLTEAQFERCPHCEGVGNIRTPDATTIMLLRAIEDEGIKERAAELIVHVSNRTAIYLLNHKRVHLDEIEQRYGFKVLIRTDESIGLDKFRIEVSKPADGSDDQDNEPQDNDPEDDEKKAQGRNTHEQRPDRDGNRRRGRRGGRGRNRRNNDERGENAEESDDVKENTSSDNQKADKEQTDSEEKPKRKAPASKKTNAKKDETKEKDGPEDKKTEQKSEKPKRSPRKSPAKKNVKEEDKKSSKAQEEPETKKLEPSNDVSAPGSEQEKENHASQFETVNEAPKSKKKGWWNRLVD